MKKKLFLAALMTVLFTCLLAMVINAASFESSFTKDVTEIGTGPDWADLNDKDATAVLKKADESYVRIPLYYIYQANGSTELRHEIQTTTGRTGFRYDWIGEKLNEEFTHASLVALDIPEGIQKTSGLNSYTALQEVVFPITATGLPKSENHPTLEKVFVKQSKETDGTIKGITQVSDYAFKNAKALAYFKLELDYVTYIGPNAFFNCAVEELRFEGPMTGLGSSIFGGCAKLETIYINNTSEARVSGGQIFSGNNMLRSAVLNGINLPEYTFQSASGLTDGGLTIVATNVETIGQMAFKNMVNLSSVNISGPIKSIGNSLFTGCSNLTSVTITNTSETPAACGESICSSLKKLQSVELKGISIGKWAFRDAGGTEGLTINCTNVGSIGEQAFAVQGGKSGNIVTVNVSGPIESIGANIFSNNKTVNSAIIRVVGNPFADATSVGGVSSIVLNTEYESNKSDYATGKHIVYGYNLCDLLYNGAHLISEQVYEFTSFTEKSYLKNTCTRCQSVLVEEIAPLFVNLGFSASEYDGTQMSVNYKVNAQAVIKYEEATGEKLNYGVFAVRADRIETNDIFDADGKALDGVIAADITGSGYTLFNLKITGFTSEQKDIELAMGAFVGTTKDEKTTYSYLQIAAPTNGKYYCASYNDVVELLENKVSAQ